MNRIKQDRPAEPDLDVRHDAGGDVVAEPAAKTPVKPDILDILGLRGPGSLLDDRPKPQLIDLGRIPMEVRRG